MNMQTFELYKWIRLELMTLAIRQFDDVYNPFKWFLLCQNIRRSSISVDAKMCWVANIIICIKITVLKVVLQHENISYNLCIQFAFACYNSCNLVYLWISANKSYTIFKRKFRLFYYSYTSINFAIVWAKK